MIHAPGCRPRNPPFHEGPDGPSPAIFVTDQNFCCKSFLQNPTYAVASRPTNEYPVSSNVLLFIDGVEKGTVETATSESKSLPPMSQGTQRHASGLSKSQINASSSQFAHQHHLRWPYRGARFPANNDRPEGGRHGCKSSHYRAEFCYPN